MVDFKEKFKELIEHTFIPSTASSVVKTKAWHNIYNLLIPNIPEKLYRYRSFNEYSLSDFENGKISLCHAGMFPDKYDSYIYVDRNKIHQDLEFALKNALQNCLQDVTQKSPFLKTEKASEICYYRELGLSEKQIIEKLYNNYSNFIDDIKNDMKKRETRLRNSCSNAKIGCFTESVQSKYMWDRYADGYKGFALEYDFRKCIYKYTNINLNVNLFPVIYTDILPDFTLEEGNLYVRECFSKLDVNNVWSYMLDINCPFNQLYFYKAYLYKDRKEYSHECEWRMLYYNLEDDNDYVSIPDVECLKAIYYGPDIKYENKERLHKIAMEKGIKEYEVYLDTETRDYSLQVKLFKE